MKTLLISLGLTALAGSASAFTRVYVAPPAVVISGPVCRPVTVCAPARPVVYCAPVVAFHGRSEVIVRGREPIRCVVPVSRPVVVDPRFRR